MSGSVSVRLVVVATVAALFFASGCRASDPSERPDADRDVGGADVPTAIDSDADPSDAVQSDAVQDDAKVDHDAVAAGDAELLDSLNPGDDAATAPEPCVASIVFADETEGPVLLPQNGTFTVAFEVERADGAPFDGQLAVSFVTDDPLIPGLPSTVDVAGGQGVVEFLWIKGENTVCVASAATELCPAVESCLAFRPSAVPIFARLCPPSGETKARLRVEATPLGPAIAELPPPATETCAGLAPQATAVIVVDEDHPKTVLDDGTTLLWQVDKKGCEAVSVLPGQSMMLSAYALTGCGLSEPKQAAFEGFFSEWHDGWWADDYAVLGTFGYRTLFPGAAHLLFRWHLRPLYIDNMGLAPIYFYRHPSEPGACTDPSAVVEYLSLTEPDSQGGAPWYPCAGAVDEPAAGWPFVAGQCGCGA